MRPIKDIMTTNLQWVEPGTSVRAAVAVMSRHRIGSVLVGNRGEPPAIVTETDVVRRVLAEDKNPASVTVDEIMSCPLITVVADGAIAQAGDLMAEMKSVTWRSRRVRTWWGCSRSGTYCPS
jgi:CBS domain-containing protein